MVPRVASVVLLDACRLADKFLGFVLEYLKEATGKNLNDLKLQKNNEAKVAQENLDAAKKLAEELKAGKVVLTMKVGEGGKTFGSVSSKEIAEAVKEQMNLDIDKKKIQLKEQIRTLGTHMVAVKLHPEVTAELNVSVKEA